MTKYEVKQTGVSSFKGDDLGVYKDGLLFKTFNTLGNNYAHIQAKDLVDRLNGAVKPCNSSAKSRTNITIKGPKADRKAPTPWLGSSQCRRQCG